jgi:hypothetical protein
VRHASTALRARQHSASASNGIRITPAAASTVCRVCADTPGPTVDAAHAVEATKSTSAVIDARVRSPGTPSA